jgi:hypothetical protein
LTTGKMTLIVHDSSSISAIVKDGIVLPIAHHLQAGMMRRSS